MFGFVQCSVMLYIKLSIYLHFKKNKIQTPNCMYKIDKKLKISEFQMKNSYKCTVPLDFIYVHIVKIFWS